MASSNLAVLSPEIMADILQKLAEIESALNRGTSLRPKDRQKLVKLGRKTTQFVQRVIEMTGQNPELVPAYIDREAMESNYQVYNQMLTISHVIEQVKRKVDDMKLLSGSNAHLAGLSCYKSIKNASLDNVPGAEPAYAALKTRFNRAKRNGDPPEETVPPAQAAD